MLIFSFLNILFASESSTEKNSQKKAKSIFVDSSPFRPSKECTPILFGRQGTPSQENANPRPFESMNWVKNSARASPYSFYSFDYPKLIKDNGFDKEFVEAQHPLNQLAACYPYRNLPKQTRPVDLSASKDHKSDSTTRKSFGQR